MTEKLKVYLEDFLDPLQLSIFSNEVQHQSLLLSEKVSNYQTDELPFSISNLPLLASDLEIQRDSFTGEVLDEFAIVSNHTVEILNTPVSSIPILTTLPNEKDGIPPPNSVKSDSFDLSVNESDFDQFIKMVIGKSDYNADSYVTNQVEIPQPKILPETLYLEEPLKTARRTTQKKVVKKYAVQVNISEPVMDFSDRVPVPAAEWPFELDTFQKQAILCLERGESVFIAAHTSAGKTVVAEYAIALCIKNGSRAFYTSPIKALSNQKYREFKNRFAHFDDINVGIVTGDIQIEPEATCVIMTTEILRSMLYGKSDQGTMDLEWVIFDEVHYINDPERGVVWEEVLIMLPPHVKIILLSATVPNTIEFADWIGRIKKRNIYVISTLKRPIPLEHYVFTGKNSSSLDELFMVVNQQRDFSIPEYRKAVAAKTPNPASAAPAKKPVGPAGRGGDRGGPKKRPHTKPPPGQHRAGGDPSKRDKAQLLSVVKMLENNDRLPAVIFTFSKAKIKNNVGHLNAVNLLTKGESHEVHNFFISSISRLKKDDRSLPQVKQVGDLLERGLAMHHSGILPILKEVVEILFQRGLVKLLFATETFAMGVNMPARTVVFDSLDKFDGVRRRGLLPGEYTQMAGRAGRRGLDPTGTVIILIKGESMPAEIDIRRTILGNPTKLESKFRVTYQMILNVHMGQSFEMQEMMRRSFIEATEMSLQENHQTRIEWLLQELKTLGVLRCFKCNLDIDDYFEACRLYNSLKKQLTSFISEHPKTQRNLLCTGRLVLLRSSRVTPNLGAAPLLPALVLDYKRAADKQLSCLTLQHNVSVHSDGRRHRETAAGANEDLIVPVLPVDLAEISVVSSHRPVLIKEPLESLERICSRVVPNIIAEEITKELTRHKFDPSQPSSVGLEALEEKLRAVLLDTTRSLEEIYAKADLAKLLEFKASYEQNFLSKLSEVESNLVVLHPSCTSCPDLSKHFGQVASRVMHREELESLKKRLSDDNLALLPEYKQRVAVLNQLGFLSRSKITLSGRSACELGVHEVVLTEVILAKVFPEKDPAAIAAIVSCFVYDQSHQQISPEQWIQQMPPVLQKACTMVMEIAVKVNNVERQCGLQDPTPAFVDSVQMGLVQVVYEWSKQRPFAQVIQLTDVEEGVIVRTIQRLDELLRHIAKVCRFQGNRALEEAINEASQLIKRDVVFAPSLYYTM